MIAVDDISALEYYIRHGLPKSWDGGLRYVDSLLACSFKASTFPEQALETDLFGSKRLHLAVHNRKTRISDKRFKFRSYANPLPPRSFIRLNDGIALASPELVFIELGRKLDLYHHIELGYEMLGKYRTDPERGDVLITNQQPLMTLESLRAYLSKAQNFWGVKQARRALRFLKEGSESPAETQLAMLLALPKRLGGEGLSHLKLNMKVPLEASSRALLEKDSLRLDVGFSSELVDIEYESSEFHTDDERSRTNDSKRRGILQKMGYSVITVVGEQMRVLRQFEVVVTILFEKLKRKRRKRNQLQLRARIDLREALFEKHARRKRRRVLLS